MKFDRTKYQPTKMTEVKAQQKEVNKKIGYSDNESIKWLSLDEGINRVRIYPKHPGTKSFSYPVVKHWMEQEIEKDGKKEVKRRSIYNSKTHAGTEKDIIEEYIDFVTKQLMEEIPDEEELKLRLQPLSHWKTGIKPKTEWVMYASLLDKKGKPEFGFLSLSNATKEKLNSLAVDEEADEPITIDPFTDIDKGKVVKILYNPNSKDFKDYYKISFYIKDDMVIKYPLSDKELETFAELDSLESLYTNNYTGKDFQKALNALRMFDEKNKFNVFDHDDWLNICEEVAEYYPEEGVKDKEETKEETKESTLETMDRDELKFFIKKNKLPIIVKNKYTDAFLREMIQVELEDLNESGKEEQNEEAEVIKEIEEEIKEEPIKEEKGDKAAERKARLDRLKKQMEEED